MKIVLIFIALIFCTLNVSVAQTAENFDNFYNKFHKDTTFQSKRTIYPLKGNRTWNKKEVGYFIVKANEITDTSYTIETKKTATEYIQKIYIKESSEYIEMRFKLINNKWFFVYYIDFNKEALYTTY